MTKNHIKTQGNYASIGNGANAHAKIRKSLRGKYKTAFVKTYEDITELDMDLRKDYASQLVSQFTLVPEDMLAYRKKTTKNTLSSIDEVYYVKKGQETIGKLSIRSQRTFKKSNLIIIYQQKVTVPVNVNRGIRGQKKYKKN